MDYNISVIIPTMNRPESLARTLGYIASSSYLPSEVIIIDQSSIITSREATRSVAFEYEKILNTKYVYQETPSTTKARNSGLKIAREEIIVFSDDDVDVKSTTFDAVHSLMQDSTLALIGGFNEGEQINKMSILSYIFLKASYRKRNKGHVAPGIYGRFPCSTAIEVPTEWAMGFFFVVRKSLIDKWKVKFDENLKYYGYAEDLDFTYGYYLHAKEENYKCIMNRNLTVRHNISTEFRTTQYKVTMMEMIHREYIAYKYKDHFSSISLLWCNLGTFIFRLIKRNRPSDVISAIYFTCRNRKQIHKGNFFYEEYMK